MKLSYTTMATPGMTVKEEAGLARKFGYKGIDLRVSDNLGEINISSSYRDITEVKDILNTEGIMLAGLFCYNHCAGAEDNSWDKMKQSILKHIELANLLGSPSIRIFAGNPLNAPDEKDFIKRTADIVSQVLVSDGTDTSVVLQNHLNGFSVTQGIMMAEIINNDRFGLAFSPDHSVLMGEDLHLIDTMLKKHAKQFYLADLSINGGIHKTVLPGKGNVPLKSAFNLIGAKSFRGWITVKWEKIWHQELESAEIILPYFKEYIEKNLIQS